MIEYWLCVDNWIFIRKNWNKYYLEIKIIFVKSFIEKNLRLIIFKYKRYNIIIVEDNFGVYGW